MSNRGCPCDCHGHGSAHKPPCSIIGGCGHLHRAGGRDTTEVVTSPQCVMRHRGKRRPAASVGRVCTEHLAGFRDELANIADLHGELRYAGDPLAVRGDTSGSKHTKQPYAPAPISLDYLVLTPGGTTGHATGQPDDVPDIRTVLASWSDQINKDRQLDLDLDPMDVPQLIDVLRTNLTWIVAQDWLAEFDIELRRIRTVLALAVGFDPMPAPYVEGCPYDGTMLWTDRDREVLRLRRLGQTVHLEDITKPNDRVYCPTCHNAWTGRHELARLLRMANPYPRLDTA